MVRYLLLVVLAIGGCSTSVAAAEPDERPTRLLLLAQGPDGHPPGTHEYRAGQQILKKLLAGVPKLEVTIAEAGSDWPTEPTALDDVDGVVLFISEGAKWLHAEERRREVFARFAERGGGLAAYHWAIGSRTEEPIESYVKLFGACHGGKDRKYKFLETTLRSVGGDHPITQGLEQVKLNEEFYYELKQNREAKIVPLLEADIDGEGRMVSWAWERPDGGRSFGFSGLHFHKNWSEPFYQRLMAQAVLWTVERTPPESNFPVKLSESDLQLDAK